MVGSGIDIAKKTAKRLKIKSKITVFKNFGTVERIDIVNSGRKSRKAFIHFKRWNHTDLLSRLENGDTVNLIYNLLFDQLI